MDSLPENVILQFNEDTFQSIRKDYNLDKPRAMDQAIDALEEWVKKQNHFVVKDYPRDYFERKIILAKGSVERAKAKLDKLCTLKTLMPSLFENVNFVTDFKESDIMTHALLPKLTADHYRIYLMRCSGKRFDNGFTNYYRFVIAMAEYVMAHDYCKGVEIVVEYVNVNFVELIKKLDIVEMRQALTLLIEGYGMRVKAIHIVTPSKVVETLVSILKQILSAKVAGRIQVHKDLESVYSVIPKDILPVEQGGNERSLKKLHVEWANIVSSSEFQEYFNKIKKATTNEQYRQTDRFNADYMGMPGTFRTINLD